jgi:two-component system, OmpR family, sensor kinase
VTGPLRRRLTLVFAVATAVVLAASGVFVYLRVSGELLAAVDRDLGARSDAVVGAMARDPEILLAGTHRFADPDEAFAQVLDRSGRLVDATPGRPAVPLLSPAETDRLTRPKFLTRPATTGVDPTRLLAVPATVEGESRVVVVGATLGDRQDALGQLLGALVIVGLLATVLASWGAWVLAGVALAPVEAAVRRERRLVDDASHELRTPLAVVKAELDLALSRPRTAGELRRTVAAAARETDRLVRLTEDLLVWARYRQGALPLRRQPTWLPAAVDSGLVGLRDAAVAAGRSVEVRVDHTTVSLDPERLHQVLVNLVDNAVKHGAGTVTVRAGVSADGGALELDIGDDGPGRPDTLPDNAFEPFRRGPAARAAGAGLGLAIVKAVVDAQSGSVHTYRENGGSGVRVVLPLDRRPVSRG